MSWKSRGRYAALSLLVCAGCSGLRETGTTFTVHAECIRLFGFPIPRDDQEAAAALVPEGATITSVSSTPSDWSSVRGILGNILGIDWTHIGGIK